MSFDINAWMQMMRQVTGLHFKVCPLCGQEVQLTKKRKLFFHRTTTGEKCEGSGDYGHGPTTYQK
jgi:hypothetical protein